MKAKKARNDANNANTVRNAAEIASKTSHPIAKGIGEGVKIADNLTGGKASQAIGKHITRGNKFSPGGKIVQGLSNRLAESGTGDKLGNAASRLGGLTKGNKPSTGSRIPNLSSKSPTENSFLNNTKQETEEMASDGGFTNFKISQKAIKIGLIACAISFSVVVFVCLIIAATQTFLNAVSLGISDSLNWTTDKEIEENINKMDEDDLNNQVTDDKVDDLGFNDIYVNDTFKESKLNNYVQIRKTTIIKRPYTDIDIKNIEEYFPSVKNLKKEYDEDMVYDFFFKMYKLHRFYKENYSVNLDLPLLMSTLKLESSDMYEVFKSNITNEKFEFDYYYDWTVTDYKLTEDDSEHDMEVLAQNMVSKQVKEKCVNSSENLTNYSILKDDKIGTVTLTCEAGDTYQTEDLGYVLDEEKYDDFLKEFLEKKYYFSGEYKVERKNIKSENDTSVPQTSTVGKNSMADAMVKVALAEVDSFKWGDGGVKYNRAYGTGDNVAWCAAFVWYVASKTEVDGVRLYPDIIKYKANGTGRYIQYFSKHPEEGLKFYYNDSCSDFKGKNGDMVYTPKPGDFVFIDWEADSMSDVSLYNGESGNQDHTGMVEKYENGKVYTIEGNRGIGRGKLGKFSFSASDCRIIGYGSWY